MPATSALRRFASLLADQVRLVDTIGRVGADEFGIIAPGGGGMVVAQRVGAAAQAIKLADGSKLSVSAANVVFPGDGASSTELIRPPPEPRSKPPSRAAAARS